MSVHVRFTVAIDLAKRCHVACILNATTGVVCETVRVPVTQAGYGKLESRLTAYSEHPDEFMIGCEATGHYGETLLRRLQNQGYPIIRINPAQVVQFRRGLGRRAKTDRLDAEAMALQLAVTDFVPDQPVNETQQSLQRLTRLRLDFVAEQSRWVNRVRALINQIFPEVEPFLKKITSATTLKLLERYPSRQALADVPLRTLTQVVERASRKNKGRDFAQRLKAAAQSSVGIEDRCLEAELTLVVRQLIALTHSIHEMEHEIALWTERYLLEYSENLNLDEPLTIKSFPYGSSLAIGTLLAEMGSLDRFSSVKQLLSYFGWCPETKQSGESQALHAPLSRRGNRFARRILWMLSIGAIRWVPEYQRYYQQRIDAGKNKMKSIIAVGRKYLSVVYAILRTGQSYDSTRYLQYSATT